MSTLVRLINVQKFYRLGRVDVRGLRDVTMDIADGGFVALAGPSGSGKTTLLNLIGCIDKPSAGRILIGNIDVTNVPLHRLADTRSTTLGYIFQTFNLIPVLTAYENVEYPLLLCGLSRREREARVRHWLAAVGLETLGRHRPDQLSGGQRQRVAIARAMVADPKLVLADEPTANLDSDTGGEILALMQRINERTGRTFIFATHDPSVMERASRVIHLRDGQIVSNDSCNVDELRESVAVGGF